MVKEAARSSFLCTLDRFGIKNYHLFPEVLAIIHKVQVHGVRLVDIMVLLVPENAEQAITVAFVNYWAVGGSGLAHIKHLDFADGTEGTHACLKLSHFFIAQAWFQVEVHYVNKFLFVCFHRWNI